MKGAAPTVAAGRAGIRVRHLPLPTWDRDREGEMPTSRRAAISRRVQAWPAASWARLKTAWTRLTPKW